MDSPEQKKPIRNHLFRANFDQKPVVDRNSFGTSNHKVFIPSFLKKNHGKNVTGNLRNRIRKFKKRKESRREFSLNTVQNKRGKALHIPYIP